MIYLALATFIFLLIRCMVTTVNFLQQPKLKPARIRHDDFVSVLIPARNEAANIGATIRAIENFDHLDYELLILDDHSIDETAAIVRQAAARNPRVHLVTGKPLPGGWLGKTWACHQLGGMAQGQYLLFLDADVMPSPSVVHAALSEMKRKKLSLLSLFPDQLLLTEGEKIVVPVMHYLLLTMLPLKLVLRSREHLLAAANGQFMLFEANTYRRHLWHEQVKSCIVEDIEIAKNVKKSGSRASTLLANHLIHCRMYHSYEEAVNGFSKNIIPGFGNSLSLLFIYLLLITVGYPALLLYSPLLFVAALLMLVLNNAMLAQLSNQSLQTTILLHPLRVASLLIICMKAIYGRLSGTTEWKGRKIVQ